MPPLAAVASLEPTRRGATLVAPDTAFILRSLDGTPVVELASRIDVEPPIRLIAGVPDGDTLTLRPAGSLTADESYRFTLSRADGSIAQTWAVTAATELSLVGSIPGDHATDVPIDTAIELTFDQGGVAAADVEDHFAISPAATGRFESRGRSVTFIPDEPLRPSTIYSVTLTEGLPLAGTGQSMPGSRTIAFATKGTKAQQDVLWIERTLVDVAVGEVPIVEGTFYERNRDGNLEIPATLAVTVHRLGTVEATIAAWRRLAAAEDWGDWAVAADPPVATSGLERILTAEVALQQIGNPDDQWSRAVLLRLPEALPRGWYVVTAETGGRSEQVLVQVANIAAFAEVTETRTAVWVNSVGTGEPIAGATVSLGAAPLGSTDRDGLLVAATPRGALAAAADGTGFVTVRAEGRTLLVPLGPDYWWGYGDPSNEDWWHVLVLDRQRLRPTDRVDAWGVVKARADGSVPEAVEVTMETWRGTDPPVAAARARPLATGMFTVELPFRDAPVGDYQVVVRADGTVIDSQYVRIEPIIKPAFQVDVTTSRQAVVNGTTIDVGVAATFFEGTPVAGVDLRVGAAGWWDEEEDARNPGIAARTDLDGRATVALPITIRAYDGDSDVWSPQWERVAVRARPALPEEAGIQGQTSVAVFRSTALLDVEADLEGDQLLVTGSVHDVDFGAMERLTSSNEDPDPRGDPRAGTAVRLKVIELRSVRTKTGTMYDPITKTVRPAYAYQARATDLGTRTVETMSDGTFRLAMDVAAGRDYQVVARHSDEAGREIMAATWASSARIDAMDEPWLSGSADDGDARYAVGEAVSVEMLGGHPQPADDRYLFLVSSLGLRQAQVQAGPVFATAFRSAWVPSASIRGVRFTGSAYEVANGPYTFRLDTDTRTLTVQTVTDRDRYEPGDTVRLSVRVADGSGQPVSATVAVRAIDEKLYTVGAAQDVDVLDALYGTVPDGVVAVGWSHGIGRLTPSGDTAGGDGGDVRSEFRDSVLFRVVPTGAEGRASVTFDLSDDLTSWRVSATAVDSDLRAGSGAVQVPVGLPFFVEATLAEEYLVADRPILRLRAYGSELAADAPITFTVSSTSLGLPATSVTARAFTAAALPLPELTVGRHSVRITASTGTGAARREDILVRTFTVVPTRTVATRTASAPLVAGFELEGGLTGFTKLFLTDSGRGRVVPTLLSMLHPFTARGDAALAASVARSVLVDGFGLPAADVGHAGPVDLAPYQSEGAMGLLPYGSPDLELSALAAFAGDPALDRDRLQGYLNWPPLEEAARTREQRIVALAGRAALGEPVLDAIREAAAEPDLTPRERAWLSLAALAGGDEDLAANLERDLLADSGERLGSWVRVSPGDREETANVTALLAITAAGIGDPLAADMDAYLASVPPRDGLVVLQRALAARLWAKRTPAADAAAVLTVDGASRRLEIQASAPVVVSLTPSQLRRTRLEPVSGSILVTSSYEAPLDPAALDPHGISTFERTVSPAGTIGLDDVVVVEYHVVFGEDADLGCWRLTDFVPSGLAPIAGNAPAWYPEGADRVVAEGPWRVAGQRVDFCTSRPPDRSDTLLRYRARVVTPGAYAWEAVAIQSTAVPTWGRVIPATRVIVAAG